MKVRDIDEVKQEVDAIQNDGKSIDKKIKNLVIGLRRWGINTDNSCEGHLLEGLGLVGGLGFPWVDFPIEQARDVALLLLDYNFEHPIKSTWVLKPYGGFMRLQPEHHHWWRLGAMQKEAEKFTKFLFQLCEGWWEERYGEEIKKYLEGKYAVHRASVG